jgi:phosphatidylglycerol:prolipoprotein diacylglycerol transferase
MVEFGGFVFHLYGFLVGLGILSGFWVASRFAGKFEITSSDVWDGLWWMFIPGIIGARLYHVLDFWEYYRENLRLIPEIWTGGLGIFGAVLGGLLGLWFFARRRKIPFFALTDLLAFGLPVGQAIGRWGNFFNQELYGKPFDMIQGSPPFFAISIKPESRLSGFEEYTYFHPVFLYESVYSILVFGLLLWLWRVRGGRLVSGSYFSLYLVLYGAGRFFV